MEQTFSHYIEKVKKFLTSPMAKRFAMFSGIALAIIIPIGTTYHFWRKHIEEKAFKELCECTEQYHMALDAQPFNTEPLIELADRCSLAYKNHSHSYLRPYFRVCEAFARLCTSQKIDEYDFTIQQLLLDASKEMSPSNPLKMYYDIARANILLTYGSSEQKKEALEVLISCSHQKNNPLHELAIYFHGLYTFYNDSLQAAETIWQPILYDPSYNGSAIKALIIQARNLDA